MPNRKKKDKIGKLFDILEVESFEEHFQFLNDFEEKIKDLSNCNFNYQGCSEEKRQKCACESRKLNLLLLKKLRFYEKDFEKLLKKFSKVFKLLSDNFENGDKIKAKSVSNMLYR